MLSKRSFLPIGFSLALLASWVPGSAVSASPLGLFDTRAHVHSPGESGFCLFEDGTQPWVAPLAFEDSEEDDSPDLDSTVFAADLEPKPILDHSWEEVPSQLDPFHRRLALDVWDLVRKPARMDRRQWLRLGAGALAVGAVSLLDDQIRDSVRDGGQGSRDLATTVRPIGREAGLVFLGVSWMAGKTFDKPRLRAMATDGMEATLLSAGLVTPALKTLFGRDRPRSGLGSSSFSGSESFPSGETTEAFAIASVVSAHADKKWVKGLAWGLAGLTAWQRIELDAHWGSDVLAGALIGSATGRWVVRRNRGRRWGERRWSVSPMVGEGSYGLGATLTFGNGLGRSGDG
ncbi:MAG: phosphatase PAP2 family protein [Acidobacteria bacterium]|nr:phosphatase PAP2 family protein [Acidobacteriota bacterium]